ncbi:MAG: phosphoenolpyruvate carboxykinase domain-containing protein, partial [Serpentinimonas sp.]|nr:phosphoenolpyruvate carboxykinase domain-containing protein [Serpentinimonas sp.]
TDLNWDGLAFSAQQFETVSHIDAADWAQELASHDAHFEQLAHHLPPELLAVKARLAQRLAAGA